MEYIVMVNGQVQFHVYGDDYAGHFFVDMCKRYPQDEMDMLLAETGEIIASHSAEMSDAEKALAHIIGIAELLPR